MMTAQFTTPLRLEVIATDRWQLHEPLVYESEILDRTVTVPDGFITDLASVPRWIPLTYSLFAGTACAAAVLHDFLYQTHAYAGLPIRRRLADRIFAEAMVALKEPAWRAWLMYRAVRLFGRRAYESGPYRAHRFRAVRGWPPVMGVLPPPPAPPPAP